VHSSLTLSACATFTAAVTLVAGCRATAPALPAAPVRPLALQDTLRLASPAVAICPDGQKLVVLEASGTRLLCLKPGLVRSETIPLTRRLAAPRGIAADRFYYYVYDDQVLYRMSKEKLELAPWLANVRVSGLASFSPGEMLVADEERDVIWYKTLFGDSRRFIDISTVTDPAQLTALPGGMFCVLNGPRSMSWFNRAGIITRTLALSARPDLMTSNAAGDIFQVSRQSSRVQVLSKDTRTEYGLPGILEPTSVAVLGSIIAVLDRDNRILTFRLP
jgi:hypothetical protein